MPVHIDYNDPQYAESAAEILRRHDNAGPEANITSAVRDFLIATGLAGPSEIVEENPPAQGSRRAVDLTALDTFIEFKRRIGSTGDSTPTLSTSNSSTTTFRSPKKQGRLRMGILTDGRHWLLRWPNAGPVKVTPPYAFTLEDPDHWITLYEWLRDHALSAEENTQPSRATIAERFGPNSPSYQRDIAALKALYDKYADFNTIKVKRQLWQNLLTAALGELASEPDRLDDLFVRHTYLTAVIGMVVQASFGSDIYRLAETDPADLLHGRDFRSKTGLQGVVESDFFAWPVEVGGLPLLRTLARRVARFDWQQAPNDVAAILYETVIPPDERRQLGEYYTPDWLAQTMIREVVTDPLNQTVLDPACGSGTFVAEAVTHLIEAARETSLDPKQVLERLRFSVAGIDVHPVAVHLARAAWVLAAQPAIQAAVEYGFAANVTVPIYLGDALQLRFRIGDMFAEHNITIQTVDDRDTDLTPPEEFVERPPRPEHRTRLPRQPRGTRRDVRRTHGRHRRSYRERDRSPSGPRRPRHHRSRRETIFGENRRVHAATAYRGPQSHLGILHPKPRPACRPVPQQGGRDRRQPALAELQSDCEHPAKLSWSGRARTCTAFGQAAATPLTRTLLACSSLAALTCT